MEVALARLSAAALNVTWSMGASGLYSMSNVCTQALLIHSVVVVMRFTTSSNGMVLKIGLDAHRARNASSALAGSPLRTADLHADVAFFFLALVSTGGGLHIDAVSVTVKIWLNVEHAGVGDHVGDWVGLVVGDSVGDAVGEDVVGLVVGGDVVGDRVGDSVGQELATQYSIMECGTAWPL